MRQKMGVVLEAGKQKETYPIPEPPERNIASSTP